MRVKLIGESQLQVLATCEQKFLFWDSLPAHTGQIEQVEFLLVTEVATGYLGRCTRQVWLRNQNRFREMTA